MECEADTLFFASALAEAVSSLTPAPVMSATGVGLGMDFGIRPELTNPCFNVVCITRYIG